MIKGRTRVTGTVLAPIEYVTIVQCNGTRLFLWCQQPPNFGKNELSLIALSKSTTTGGKINLISKRNKQIEELTAWISNSQSMKLVQEEKEVHRISCNNYVKS